MAGRFSEHTFADLHEELHTLAVAIERRAAMAAGHFDSLHPRHRPGAANMLRYVALRGFDLRDLQRRLHRVGLSSLGRSESHVADSLQAVLRLSARLGGRPGSATPIPEDHPDAEQALAMLHANTDALFGPPPEGRNVRIMVTAPAAAAEDPMLVDDLIAAGADILRVNCAHDDAGHWRRSVANLERSCEARRRPAIVFMDLPGPKLRTGPLSGGDSAVRLFEGDHLLLGSEQGPGHRAERDAEGRQLEPHRYACTIPEVLERVAEGATVSFNDGKILGVVRERRDGEVLIEVVRSRPHKGRPLKPDMGINFPGTDLGLDALTEEDRDLLPVIRELADIAGLSYARSAADVHRLVELLAELGDEELGIVLKIESRQGFEQLPDMLLAAMRRRRVGVMVARGDLAAEVGFERLAELQEEILWLCEAAHVPVIWATQVLEGLVKKGVASRGEVSDAAIAGRAECVLLNKGPQIVAAVRTLDDILRRMAEHRDKKMDLLRRLRSWRVPD